MARWSSFADILMPNLMVNDWNPGS